MTLSVILANLVILCLALSGNSGRFRPKTTGQVLNLRRLTRLVIALDYNARSRALK